MRRFLVQDDLSARRSVRLTGPEAHHARNVLRLVAGAEVVLVDAGGRDFRARVTGAGPEGLDLEVLEPLPGLPEPGLELTLGLALIKWDLMDLVVQKGTELGLTRFVPVVTARTTARPAPDREVARLERWGRITRQSLKQCRRRVPVDLQPVAGLDDFLDKAGGADLKLILHKGAPGNTTGWPSLLSRNPRPSSIWALVGPEGGFTREEVEKAMDFGFEVLEFGPRILRAETAAMALMAVLGFEYGDFT